MNGLKMKTFKMKSFKMKSLKMGFKMKSPTEKRFTIMSLAMKHVRIGAPE